MSEFFNAPINKKATGEPCDHPAQWVAVYPSKSGSLDMETQKHSVEAIEFRCELCHADFWISMPALIKGYSLGEAYFKFEQAVDYHDEHPSISASAEKDYKQDLLDNAYLWRNHS